MRTNLLSSLIQCVMLLSLLWGCGPKQVDPQLPPETATGQNTLGCLINGKVWLPGGKYRFGFGAVTMSYDPGYHQVLNISAEYNRGEQSLTFKKNGVKGPGTYRFEGDSTAGLVYRDESLPPGCGDFLGGTRYQPIQEGRLTITRLDVERRVIAGRFSFTLVQPGCDTIRITEGRFDLPLR
ncbi:hypothetical protein ACFSUS_00150 [Spirosoma soli]|uniref:Lipoprotein n=1 Tax=Spirosoma soli TaxID=1770529 RepID=A0ABW5LW48_9BACT